VHLRRALLLFAIVLGLAAIAASVSRPGDEETAPREPPATVSPSTEPEQPPTVSPGTETPSQSTAQLTFEAGTDEQLRLDAGRSATVLVESDEPGVAAIPDLGVSSPAEPLTPARFEVFTTRSGRYPVVFTPAGGEDERGAGTLVVTPVEE
jgi:hypothetical protein